MPSKSTRRQFLSSSLLVSAGLGMRLSGLKMLTDPTPTPSAAPEGLPLTGAFHNIHDPSIIKADSVYYVFCTGPLLTVRKSADLLKWEMPFAISVFGSIPDWAKQTVTGAVDMWAPDISFYNGKYQLYYAVSTFGKNGSVIGLATNTTLDEKAEGFNWVDEGLVIESTAANNYNCIDPNFVLDADGNPWLAFGSFWTGIKMRRLDAETRKLSSDDTVLYALAQRPNPPDAIEAPFIFRHGDYYYLFVSFDQCCQGVKSTYHVMVGRADTITGPYADRDGVEMLKGGGTQVTFPTDRWKGPGHCAVLHDGDTDYLVYHTYDAQLQGTRTMQISPLVWDADGWPSISTGV